LGAISSKLYLFAFRFVVELVQILNALDKQDLSQLPEAMERQPQLRQRPTVTVHLKRRRWTAMERHKDPPWTATEHHRLLQWTGKQRGNVTRSVQSVTLANEFIQVTMEQGLSNTGKGLMAAVAGCSC